MYNVCICFAFSYNVCTMYIYSTCIVQYIPVNRKPFYSIHILYNYANHSTRYIYMYLRFTCTHTCNCSTTVVVVVVVVARTSENIYSVVESVLASSECNSDIGQGTECRVQSAEVSLSWF